MTDETANNPLEELAPEAAQSLEGGSYQKAKRNKNLHIREKIRAAVILERLERNALGELDPPMDAQQIKSAEICLKKAIPDLSAVEISNDAESGGFKVLHTIELRALKALDAIASRGD